MDRSLIAGGLLLLFLEVGFLLVGLDEPPGWLSHGAGVVATSEAIGEVRRIEKSVRRRSQTSLVWTESAVSDKLYERDAILTPPKSRAQLELLGGDEITLEEKTLVVLDRPDQSGINGLTIRLSRGSLRLARLSRPISINTGEFTIAAAKDSELTLVNVEGSLYSIELTKGLGLIVGAEGEKPIQKGERLTLNGSTIEDRRRISDSLGWNEEVPATIYSRGPAGAVVPLRWRGVADQVQVISPSGRIEKLSLTGKNSHDFRAPESGVFRFSLERGEDVSETRSIHVKKAPEFSYLTPLPRDRAIMGVETTFTWRSLGPGYSYRLQLSRNEKFQSVFYESPLESSTSRKLGVKEPGELYWRVLAYDVEGIELPESPIYSFFVEPEPLHAPDLKPPRLREPAKEPFSKRIEGSSGSMKTWHPSWSWLFRSAVARAEQQPHETILSWDPVAGADHYIIEISKTSDFRSPLVITRVKRPSYAWKGLAPGRYYWRVAAGRGSSRGLFSAVSSANFEGSRTQTTASLERNSARTEMKKREPSQEAISPRTQSLKEKLAVASTSSAEAAQEVTTSTQAVSADAVVGSLPSSSAQWRSRIFQDWSYRSVRSEGGSALMATYAGIIPVSLLAEVTVPFWQDLAFDVSAGYSQVTWKPKKLVAPLHPSITDRRWKVNGLARSFTGAWGFGFGGDSVVFPARAGLEESNLVSVFAIGPSLRFQRELLSGKLELSFALRFNATTSGGHAVGRWLFVPFREGLSSLRVGPTIRFESHSSEDSRKSREDQYGISTGLEW